MPNTRLRCAGRRWFSTAGEATTTITEAEASTKRLMINPLKSAAWRR